MMVTLKRLKKSKSKSNQKEGKKKDREIFTPIRSDGIYLLIKEKERRDITDMPNKK